MSFLSRSAGKNMLVGLGTPQTVQMVLLVCLVGGDDSYLEIWKSRQQR